MTRFGDDRHKQGHLDRLELTSRTEAILDVSPTDLDRISREMNSKLRVLGRDGELISSMLGKLTTEGVAFHTLFGPKPLSVMDFDAKNEPDESRHVTTAEWEAWVRTLEKRTFVSSRFVLRKAEGYAGPAELGELFLYDVRKVTETADHHLARFKRVLGSGTTPNTILEMCHNAPELNALCKGNDELKGILLGFGQKSSEAFARREALRKECQPEGGISTEETKEALRRAFPDLDFSPAPLGREQSRYVVRGLVLKGDAEAEDLHARYRCLVPAIEALNSGGLLVGAVLGRLTGRL